MDDREVVVRFGRPPRGVEAVLHGHAEFDGRVFPGRICNPSSWAVLEPDRRLRMVLRPGRVRGAWEVPRAQAAVGDWRGRYLMSDYRALLRVIMDHHGVDVVSVWFEQGVA